jgi:hypothetical protein
MYAMSQIKVKSTTKITCKKRQKRALPGAAEEGNLPLQAIEADADVVLQ